MIRYSSCIFILIVFCFLSCKNKDEINNQKRFELHDAKNTSIDFINEIIPNDTLNLLTYEYLYNGGGVGVGDFNNDNLPDLIFTGNRVKSRIYINKGNFKFVDITNSSGFDTKGEWSAGVSVIDINNDGLDDIYICVGGFENKSIYPNKLFINKGNLKFEESAEEYGLNDPSQSNQSVFFDYDKDGDLDMYLLNGGGFERSAIEIRTIIKDGSARNSDKLYQNNFDEKLEHAYYTDVSKNANITIEGFGLGVGIVDANYDSWPDVYVSNDYVSKDLLYINNHDGTFTEKSEEYFGHHSYFSMGNDIADINNDMLADIVTLDMLPHDYYRQKMMFGPNQQDRFYQSLLMGYGHQYMRNMLHLGQYKNKYAEVGRLAGIEKTDWSWCPLIADFDNDGLRDLYITNGFGQDITDLDYVNFRKNLGGRFTTQEEIKKKLIHSLKDRPTIETSNFLYKNNGDLKFENVANTWGLNQKSISNGAVYVDLDNDGDLDIVTNNVNQPPFVHENKTQQLDSLNNHFLTIKLKGDKQNLKAIGSTIKIFHGSESQIHYVQNVRGYQSTVTGIHHFGLGKNTIIDSIKVEWGDDEVSFLKNVNVNQQITINKNTSKKSNPIKIELEKYFTSFDKLVYQHKENNNHNDFVIQPLLLHNFSNQGPGSSVADVNGDGLDDIFFGGALGYNAQLFIQSKNNSFTLKELDTKLYEDLGSLFCDIDKDGDNDLIIASGGSEKTQGNESYQIRAYINDGIGNFTFDKNIMPVFTTSASSISGADYDNDGDLDLFVGGRVMPGKFPLIPQSYLLENNNGKFTDVTNIKCKELSKIGMVTSSVWSDYNNDNQIDLIVVGEMMKINIFENRNGYLANVSSKLGLDNTHGLWNSVTLADLDNDGDMDYVLGNVGLNTPYNSSAEYPMKLHYGDFDKNGSIDPIYSYHQNDDYFPYSSLDVMARQLPAIKKTYLKYDSFAKATTKQLLKSIKSDDKTYLKCEIQSSIILINNGNKGFAIKELPRIVQSSPINGISIEDINEDGLLDIISVGNDYNVEVVGGRYDASIGHVLLNKGGLKFELIDNYKSGFITSGDARALTKLRLANGSLSLIATNNNGKSDALIFKKNKSHKTFRSNETYAIIKLKNGSKKKIENTLGSGYLTQNSKTISISSLDTQIAFYNAKGKEVRTEIITQ